LCDPTVILRVGLIIDRRVHAFAQSDELVGHGRNVLLRKLRAEFGEFMPIDVFSGDVELSFDAFFDWNAVDIKTEREEHVVSLHSFVASGKIDMGVMHCMTSVQWARGVSRGNIDAIGFFRTGEIEMINLHFFAIVSAISLLRLSDRSLS